MRNWSIFLVSLALFTNAAFADFFDEYDRIFKSQELCEVSISQILASDRFKSMYETLKNDENLGRSSDIEVLDHGVYTTRLMSRSSKTECAIVLHEDCYSAYCESEIL